MKEEGDELLIGAVGPDAPEGGDVGLAVFALDDEQGVACAEQDEVGEQASRPAIAVAEGMQVLEVAVPLGCHQQGMQAVVEGLLCRGHQAGNASYQRLMVAKDGVAGNHVLRGILARPSSWHAIAKGVLRNKPVDLLQQSLVERGIQMGRHVVEGPKMVGYLHAFKQRVPHWNHRQALFAEDTRIIDRERVALDGAGMGGEQDLTILHPRPGLHPVGNLAPIVPEEVIVLLYFSFKHRNK